LVDGLIAAPARVWIAQDRGLKTKTAEHALLKVGRPAALRARPLGRKKF
jgi:hypothetical protein